MLKYWTIFLASSSGIDAPNTFLILSTSAAQVSAGKGGCMVTKRGVWHRLQSASSVSFPSPGGEFRFQQGVLPRTRNSRRWRKDRGASGAWLPAQPARSIRRENPRGVRQPAIMNSERNVITCHLYLRTNRSCQLASPTTISWRSILFQQYPPGFQTPVSG